MNELRPLLPSDCTKQACHQFSTLCCAASPSRRRVSTLVHSGRFGVAKPNQSSKKERSESCKMGAEVTQGNVRASGHRYERQADLPERLRAACSGTDPSNTDCKPELLGVNV